jgi:PAS domain S-box-containing protein
MLSEARRFPLLLSVAFLAFAILIGLAGYLYYRNQREIFVADQQREIEAIADLKVDQITRWLKDMQLDAQYLFASPFPRERVQRWMTRRRDGAATREMLTWMTSVKDDLVYKSVGIFDLAGQPLLSLPEGEPALSSYDLTLAREAVDKRLPVHSDLHRDVGAGPISYDLFVPYMPAGKSPAATAVVLRLQADPNELIYPVLQTWPVPRNSAEVMLVAVRNNRAIVLNELRYRTNAALELSQPLDQRTTPVAMAAHGTRGVVEGTDYRGVQVLAAIHDIPDNPSWFLIAKVDASEVYAPLHERARITIVFASLAVLVLALTVGVLWRRRDAHFYRAHYEAELAKQALSRHYLYLTKYANDIIFLMDSGWNIVEANDRALESYGYTREEMLRRKLGDLYAPDHSNDFQELVKNLGGHDGARGETVHQKCDGTQFPVESSARLIEIEGKRFYQCILRDISARKQAEEALRASEREYRALMEQAFEGIVLFDRVGLITAVNQSACAITGFDAAELLELKVQDFVVAHGRAVKSAPLDGFQAGGMLQEERRIRRKDSSFATIEGNARSLNGELSCWIFRDVTEQRRLEKEILDLSLRQEQEIGRDLHDVLGQTLIAAGLSAKTLVSSLDSTQLAAHDARQLEALITEAITQMRALARGLCPIDFSIGGLVAALTQLAANTQTIAKIPCVFTTSGNVTVEDQSAGMHVYLIAREAVNNSIKHAAPTEIRIDLYGNDKSVILKIEDNGIGFLQGRKATAGMGLQTMKYRAKLIGAGLEIAPSEGGGTRVVCTLNREQPGQVQAELATEGAGAAEPRVS